MADNRKSNYAITIRAAWRSYEDICSYLSNLHIPCVISPLHGDDVFTQADLDSYKDKVKRGQNVEGYQLPVVGEKKDEHYHIIVSNGRNKWSVQQVLDMFENLDPRIRWAEPVQKLSSYTRYLCHLDDPEKAQYPISEVRSFGGFDLSPLWEATTSERKEARSQLIEWVKEYRIFNFADLVDVVVRLDAPTLIDVAFNESNSISKYIDANYKRVKGIEKSPISVDDVVKAIREDMRPVFNDEVGLGGELVAA